MDWALAIRRNREQLKTIVLALFVLAGIRPGPPLPVSNLAGRPLFILPRSTVAQIMAVLRPAESAVRRLIVIVARGMALRLRSNVIGQSPPLVWSEGRARPVARPGQVRQDGGGSYRTFPLFDPLKGFDPDAIWDSESAFESGYNLAKSVTWHDTATDHTPTDATHLGHRLNAILRALNDLPRQARRLKRWELKRDAALKASKPTRLSPMRPGLPPGWRERRTHEIDGVLKECHRLANDRLDSG